MARAKTILQSEFPYNISGRCINQEWFHLPMDVVWEIFSQELILVNLLHKLQIHSFVLMSNHFHLIASTPNANINKCMHLFMGNVSRRLTAEGNRINQTFSGRYFKTILDHQSYFMNAYKYNYRNPVHAGLTTKVEDYTYSSLHGLLGKTHLQFPVREDVTLFSNVNRTLEWLNTEPNPNKLEAVRYALKRPFFRPKKQPLTNAVILSELEII